MLTEKQQVTLRKAYYVGALDAWLNANLATGEFTPELEKDVYTFLGQLQEEKRSQAQKLTTFDIQETIALPGVSELMALPEGKKEALEAWEAKREQDYLRAREIFAKAKTADIRVNSDQYLDWGFELAQIQYDLDVYRVWKDQLYHARLVEIMDSYRCSRAEAEERARLTPEYRDYKKAVLFRDLVEEVIMLCKKKYSI